MYALAKMRTRLARLSCKDGVMNSLLTEPVLTDRIRAEYREVPALRLTIAQAARFWGIDVARCADALDQLCAVGFLMRTPDGHYRVADRP